MSEEKLDITVHLAWLNLMEDEYICCLCQKWEMEPFLNPSLRTTSEEELDIWDLGHKLAKDRQDC